LDFGMESLSSGSAVVIAEARLEAAVAAARAQLVKTGMVRSCMRAGLSVESCWLYLESGEEFEASLSAGPGELLQPQPAL
jgi:hypothetical protein